jgi:hypothetical protein
MTYYDQFFAAAAWQEFARVHPYEAKSYREFPGLCRYLRPMVDDFFKAYEGR